MSRQKQGEAAKKQKMFENPFSTSFHPAKYLLLFVPLVGCCSLCKTVSHKTLGGGVLASGGRSGQTVLEDMMETVESTEEDTHFHKEHV